MNSLNIHAALITLSSSATFWFNQPSNPLFSQLFLLFFLCLLLKMVFILLALQECMQKGVIMKTDL
jgi:hypothetical protein